MSMKNLNILLSIITLIFCFIFYKSAINIVEPADIYPKTLIIVIGILAIIILIQAVFFRKNDKAVYPFSNIKYRRVMLTTVSTFIYYFCVKYVGFYVSSFIFIIILSILLGKKEAQNKKEIVKVILISLIVMIVIYLGFGLFLKVPTPKALLF